MLPTVQRQGHGIVSRMGNSNEDVFGSTLKRKRRFEDYVVDGGPRDFSCILVELKEVKESSDKLRISNEFNFWVKSFP